MTTTITTPKRKLNRVRNGTHHQFNIDQLTLVRLQYATARAGRLFQVPVSLSSIVRCAVAQYVADLDRTHGGLAGLDPDSEKYNRARIGERHRLMSANLGGSAPWPTFPVELLSDEPESLKSIITRANKADAKDALSAKTQEEIMQEYLNAPE
jgi:hypothetical protein